MNTPTTSLRSLISRIAARIESFADLFGLAMGRSNGLMLERATVRCHQDIYPWQDREVR